MKRALPSLKNPTAFGLFYPSVLEGILDMWQTPSGFQIEELYEEQVLPRCLKTKERARHGSVRSKMRKECRDVSFKFE